MNLKYKRATLEDIDILTKTNTTSPYKTISVKNQICNMRAVTKRFLIIIIGLSFNFAHIRISRKFISRS